MSSTIKKKNWEKKLFFYENFEPKDITQTI